MLTYLLGVEVSRHNGSNAILSEIDSQQASGVKHDIAANYLLRSSIVFIDKVLSAFYFVAFGKKTKIATRRGPCGAAERSRIIITDRARSGGLWLGSSESRMGFRLCCLSRE